MRAVVTGAWFKDTDGVLHRQGAEVDVDADRLKNEYEPNGVLAAVKQPAPKKAAVKSDEGEGAKKLSPSKPRAPRKSSPSDDG